MKLYSGVVSPFSSKVRIALAEKGLEYERIDVPFSLDAPYSPTHEVVAKVNPLREVPVLVDGELALYDSTVILEYLEDRYAKPPLYPPTPEGRARCRQLEQYADDVLFRDVNVLINHVFYRGRGRAPDEALIEKARSRVVAHAEYLNTMLNEPGFFLGDFTVADIALCIHFGTAFSMGTPFPAHLPLFGAWFQAAGQRRSVAEDVAGMVAYIETHAR